MLIICFRSTARITTYSSLPKFNHYDDVIPLYHHICNIFKESRYTTGPDIRRERFHGNYHVIYGYGFVAVRGHVVVVFLRLLLYRLRTLALGHEQTAIT